MRNIIIGGVILPLLAAGCSSEPFVSDDAIYSCSGLAVFDDSIIAADITVTAPASTDTVLTVTYPDSTIQYPAKRHTGWRYTCGAEIVNRALETVGQPQSPDPFTIATSGAITAPYEAMKALRAMLDRDRLPVNPDWPIADNTPLWIIAAAEVYAATGDSKWLQEALDVSTRAIDRSITVNYDTHYKLVRGNAVYPDGSTTVLPRWMTRNTERLSTFQLGLNSLYVAALKATATLAAASGSDTTGFNNLADTISTSICNRLWVPNLGYFGQMLYGAPYPLPSPAIDYTAESLALLAGVVNDEVASSILATLPVVSPALPDIYPVPANTMPSVSPQRQALLGMASAAYGSANGLLHSIGSTIYASATGHDAGALAALALRAVAGIRLSPDGMTFSPVVPLALSPVIIEEIRYRDAILKVSIEGSGRSIHDFRIDGIAATDHIVPSTLSGKHTVEIVLTDQLETTPLSIVNTCTDMPPVPNVKWETPRHAIFTNREQDVNYNVWINGIMEQQISTSDYRLYDARSFTALTFEPVINETVTGFSMRPYRYFPAGSLLVINASEIGQAGTGLIKQKSMAQRYVELTATKNSILSFTIESHKGGRAFMELQYADGTSTAPYSLRQVSLNGRHCGVLVMPRTYGGPSATNLSSVVNLDLSPGENAVVIDLMPSDRKQHGSILLEKIRIIREND